jgi:hypothetical protein
MSDLTPWFVLIALLLAVLWAVWRMIEPLTKISDSLEALVDLLKGDVGAAERLRPEPPPAAPEDRVEWTNARSGAGLGTKPHGPGA